MNLKKYHLPYLRTITTMVLAVAFFHITIPTGAIHDNNNRQRHRRTQSDHATSYVTHVSSPWGFSYSFYTRNNNGQNVTSKESSTDSKFFTSTVKVSRPINNATIKSLSTSTTDHPESIQQKTTLSSSVGHEILSAVLESQRHEQILSDLDVPGGKRYRNYYFQDDNLNTAISTRGTTATTQKTKESFSTTTESAFLWNYPEMIKPKPDVNVATRVFGSTGTSVAATQRIKYRKGHGVTLSLPPKYSAEDPFYDDHDSLFRTVLYADTDTNNVNNNGLVYRPHYPYPFLAHRRRHPLLSVSSVYKRLRNNNPIRQPHGYLPHSNYIYYRSDV